MGGQIGPHPWLQLPPSHFLMGSHVEVSILGKGLENATYFYKFLTKGTHGERERERTMNRVRICHLNPSTEATLNISLTPTPKSERWYGSLTFQRQKHTVIFSTCFLRAMTPLHLKFSPALPLPSSAMMTIKEPRPNVPWSRDRPIQRTGSSLAHTL